MGAPGKRWMCYLTHLTSKHKRGITEKKTKTSTMEQVNCDRHATHSLNLNDFFISLATGVEEINTFAMCVAF